MRRVGQKNTFVLALVAALLFCICLPAGNVKAASEGSVNGTFDVGSPPIVNSVTFVPTAMNPQQEYSVTVNVTPGGRFADTMGSVVLKLWYDADGGLPTLSQFNNATSDAQNCLVITWELTGFGGQTPQHQTTWELGGTTWSIGTTVLSGLGHPAKQYTGPFDLTFIFTPGKVATETRGPAKWQIAAMATNKQNKSHWNYDSEGSAMNWYGEITVPETTVDWGKLAPGRDFSSPLANRPLGSTLNYLSNGLYSQSVKSGTTWRGNTYTATYDNSGVTSSDQQFALKANNSPALESATLITTEGSSIGSGTQTTEAGFDVATMNLWIKLAGTFNLDTYTGTITYAITNVD